MILSKHIMWLNIFFIPVHDIPLATWEKKNFVPNTNKYTVIWGKRAAPLFWFSPSFLCIQMLLDTQLHCGYSRLGFGYIVPTTLDLVIQWQGQHSQRGCQIPCMAAIILRMCFTLLIPAHLCIDSSHVPTPWPLKLDRVYFFHQKIIALCV